MGSWFSLEKDLLFPSLVERGIVEKHCDAAHFWSEMTVRDTAMILVSMLVQVF